MRLHQHILGYVLLAQGCAYIGAPADGGFRVIGSASENAECELALYNFDKSNLLVKKTITGLFEVTFVVPPRNSSYTLAASCNGELVKDQAIEYGKTTTYSKPFDIGHI